MPPVQLNAIIFEDDQIMNGEMEKELRAHGIDTVGKAYDMDTLAQLLQELKDRGVSVNMALVDNNAPWKLDGFPEQLGQTASKKIVEALGKEVIIVATTTIEHPDYGTARYNPTEGVTGKLGKFVKSLTRKES